LQGGYAEVAGGSSSQYLSALLMAAPYAKGPVTLAVTGELQSKPFVDLTLALMADFGVTVRREGYARFQVTPQRYRAREYRIEGDAMAAGYFWAAAALTGGRVRVTNLGETSKQGDRMLAEVLAQMGCKVRWDKTSCEVRAPEDGRLEGGTFDLNAMPDQAQTLGVLALFAAGPVRIENVWNMRIKETDRLSAMRCELEKFGALVEEGEDYLVVHPLVELPVGPIEIDTYGDHRMAMAFALAGLRVPGVTIRDPGCVAKTFPDFFEAIDKL
jgi:3-phosphoshikimate 1-carboxyvinyltransferase